MRCGLLPLAANNSAMQTMYNIGFSPRTDGIGSEIITVTRRLSQKHPICRNMNTWYSTVKKRMEIRAGLHRGGSSNLKDPEVATPQPGEASEAC